MFYRTIFMGSHLEENVVNLEKLCIGEIAKVKKLIYMLVCFDLQILWTLRL